MEQSYSMAFKEIEARLDELIAESSSEIGSWNDAAIHNFKKTASELDAWDFCFL